MNLFSSPLTVAEAIASRIQDAGISTIFGIPGTHVIELYRGFDRFGMRTVTPRHEQAVGFAAAAWGQASGLPGIAVTTSGPGLLNVLAAAATARCESRSLIVLSPGVPRSTPDKRIGVLHETKDSIGAAGSVVEWSRRAQSADHALELVEQALQGQQYRRSPVHIEIPIDVLGEETTFAPVRRSGMDTNVHADVLQQDLLLQEVAEILENAKKPRILAGGGAAHASAELRAIVEILASPVATTINGKGVFDERHALALGAELRTRALHEDLETADVLLVVGSKLAQAEFWSGPFRPTGRLIRIDIDPEQAEINIDHDKSVVVVGDSCQVLQSLIEKITPQARSEGCEINQLRSRIREEAKSLGGQTLELARRIADWVPDEAVVSMDSSQICYLGMNTALVSQQPNRTLQAAAYSPLGMALPAAIGAAIAGGSHQKTWCVTGDGALMFSMQELLTAAEESLDITVVVVDNGGYREIAENMVDAAIRPQGVDLLQPDWKAFAEALGAAAITIAADAPDSEFAQAGHFANEPGLRLVHIWQQRRA